MVRLEKHSYFVICGEWGDVRQLKNLRSKKKVIKKQNYFYGGCLEGGMSSFSHPSDEF